MSLSLSYIYIISYFFIKIKYFILAGAVRIELTSAVLETAVLAFERHPNILTRHNLIFNGTLPVELLPYIGVLRPLSSHLRHLAR